ncbi:MAG: ribonuclease R [Bacteroidetes bacterium GWE2_29_8]|nr:MAG: ribonuclease R [Bacteroidetes bacterium GWE2_29_8]OFY13948.1 MAG: ribonuclease R [Bacteroidetes bacterium GWF2_29_10]
MANKKETTQNDKLITDIINLFSKTPKALNFKQVATKLGINDNATKLLVNLKLYELTSQKVLKEIYKGKFQFNQTLAKKVDQPDSFIEGIVDMKSTGKAYIITNKDSEDIFISANNTNRALDGDSVKVALFPIRKGRKLEGKIVEVLKRKKDQFVGNVQMYKNYAFVVPDNNSMPVDIFIPIDSTNGAKNGEKVIAKLTEWPSNAKNPFGEIIRILGTPGTNEVEINAIIEDYGLPYNFPQEVIDASNKISLKILDEEIEKRHDFRNILTVTIDPQDAKDFDDALSIRFLENGNYEVGVHIADVSHYVKPNTLLDNEALKRGTSVYLVDRVIPMLPERLSNNICSLVPNKDRLTFSAVFEMDAKAKIVNEWFGKTIINSDRRFSYEEVQEIIETNEGEYNKEIGILNDLAKKMRAERMKNGSIDFNKVEVKFNLDEKGTPIGVYFKEMKDANKLIEEFMLMANKKVATIVGKTPKGAKKNPFVYRIHDTPNQDKLNVFTKFVNKLGYNMKIGVGKKAIAQSLNSLMIDVKGKGEENMIETLAIRTMPKAYYSSKNIGHYGLNFDFYTHFTSPIRRYPDLMVHRILYKYLNKQVLESEKDLEPKCEQASDMEKRASEAERESIKYKQVEFMKDKVGFEFDGVVSGISKWGIWVEITENKCEGMISLRTMNDDVYYLDDENYRVVGQKHGNIYKLGDNVKIEIVKADIAKRQLDFIFAHKSSISLSV